MAACSKFHTLSYSCYELGHTWTPSCFQASRDVALHVFKTALKTYGSLYLLTSLIRQKTENFSLKKWWKETLRSSVFLTINGGSFVSLFCIWRKFAGFYFFYNVMVCAPPICALALNVEQKDRKILGRFIFVSCAFVPTFFAAWFAIIVERHSRRGLLALYLANLATETAFKMCVSRGLVTPIKNGEVLFFSVVSAIYFYLFKTKRLPQSAVSVLKIIAGPPELPDYTETSNNNIPQKKSTHVQIIETIKKSHYAQIILQYLNHGPKHRLCNHTHSCSSYCIKGLLRMFGAGFCIQGSLKLLQAIPQIFKNPKGLLLAVINKENCYLGAFLGSYSGIFKIVTCLMRWLRNKDDSFSGVVAGFLAGWSMMFYKSSTITLYLASKLAEILYFRGISAGILPYVKYADIIIYSLSTAFIFHVACFEPHNLRPAYWKFLLNVTGGRFHDLNRFLLDVYGTEASKMFNKWPNYDPRYTNLTPPVPLHRMR